MTPPQSHTWFLEATTPAEGHMHAIVRSLVDTRTRFQHAQIIETPSCGKCLVLDGRMQSTQLDDFIYHEALVHPGLLTVDRPPESALVIGGGEGATLREILKYPSIRRAVMVDIDDEVVALCRRYLPEMHRGAFDDPRTEVRHEDARAYLERTPERFDLIVSDLPEPMEAGPACLLYTREFYRTVHDRLTPTGTLTMQAGMTKACELGFYTAIHSTLRQVFPVVAGYQAFVSCFGTPWGFIVASRKVDPCRLDVGEVDRLIADRIQGSLEYWDGVTHQHAFALPKHIRRAVAAERRVVTDAQPLIVKA